MVLMRRRYTRKKKIGSFTYLNITQFLGALNDNIYKLLIVFFLIDMQGVEKSPLILSKAGAIFVVPFLLFSNTAGKLADRFSKRNIIVFSKVFEAVVMFAGFLAFATKSETGAYVTLFLMALQSAIFSPSKYGIVPELVSFDKISRANGLLTSFTFLAIIIGTFLASFIVDMSSRNFVFAGVFCTIVAVVGMFASFRIEYTPPMGHKKKANPFFFYEIYRTIMRSRQENRLFCAILGSSFFLFVAAYIQLNIIPFGIEALNLSDVKGGYLFLLTAVGIGTGSMLSGKLSGKHVELGLVPFGGLGIVISCFLIHAFSDSLSAVVINVILLGIFGGIWIVPLDSFIQVSSPENYRGQMVATTNFLSFTGVLAASGAIFFFNSIGVTASQGFMIMGLITLVVTIFIMIATLDYFLRFIAFIISRTFFRLTVTGNQNLSKSAPSLILCYRFSSLIDILLLTAIQRPPLRFFVESNKHDNVWIKRLCRIVRIFLIPRSSKYNKEQLFLETKKALKRGYSVCIFAKSIRDNGKLRAKYLEHFRRHLDGTHYPIIPLNIDEKPLHPASGEVFDFIKAFPWSVSINFGVNQNQPY
jgi:acyl-[acyl-carrier-protein]-phospholipid O-acyltransferase / long-chain-fatty-acid--[acyl-carrier-protein] ligase